MTIVDVGLSDLAQAEAAAISHIGEGEAFIRESLSDSEFERQLSAGKLIEL